MKTAPWRRRCSLALSGLALCGPAAASEDTAAGPLRFSGFATLGMAHNDNATAGATTSFSQLKPVQQGWSANMDTVLGLQLEWQPAGGTTLQLQGVARAGEDMRPRLRIAALRQQLGHGLSLNLGRLRSPLFFDSSIAEIGYANLTVRPAPAIYGVVNSVASLDGADLHWRLNLGDASLLAQLFGGRYDYTHRFNNFSPALSADASLRGLLGFSLSANLQDLTLRVSHTEIDRYVLRSEQVSQINNGLSQLSGALGQLALNPQLPPPMLAALQAKARGLDALRNPFDNHPVYTSIGLDGNWRHWRLLTELTWMDPHNDLVGSGRGYSLTLARSFGDFTPYLSLARQQRSAARLNTTALAPTGLDPQLDGALNQLKQGFDRAQRFADIRSRSLSLGLRWDWRENMAIKTQLDLVRTPDAGTPGPLAVPALPFDNTLRLFSITLDLVF
ncbi:hypothetical protein OOZ63_16690 [Paucibacter sp. PLA-PC-4]|uniref:hypothetical protein n=1 Tax=Paucibacter sp. PLA-PC-4 TaxID=2993655 RepID=UPI00224B1E4A|nr:hypothetical protein [Paucibacter sp. PLA-PC-4]MCX2863470.1 hypothetical protein [Paucibacter sp. PLA-PC-4]